MDVGYKSVPFNRPHFSGDEISNIIEAHNRCQLAGDGYFTKLCQEWIEKLTGCSRALLTHSCTAALEMSALLLDIKPGDEIIMPSYTFVSTASAFVLRGGVPVFVDIRSDTLNINEALIEDAITPRTKAVVPVHYAGVSCEMDAILEMARRRGLKVVEDAAQGIVSRYKGRTLGGIGDFAAFSFHETKNIISGEGGALMVNSKEYVERAEIIREKGTDRQRFFRGEIDKYTWQDVGSSFLPGELISAFLAAQIGKSDDIIGRRLEIWERYHVSLTGLERNGKIRRPVVPQECQHNGHLYYILLPAAIDRAYVLAELKRRGVGAVFHYVPLHSSPAGRRFGRVHGDLAVTDRVSETLIRLPLWKDMTDQHVDHVVEVLGEVMAAV
ncbi:dTDP-4-amino-4,6-dideoxygalactose transaminase [mine drainage metagenome]|uniref:dTDP-4-amino-4,6-dideoxygalactose transaminase n=1 Tax=mine drainage metagenome TaxID=410659 RepID=A0A1J5R9K2_9ZZZZ